MTSLRHSERPKRLCPGQNGCAPDNQCHADKVAEYKAGKQALFGFFVGQVMKAMQGKANPKLVNDALRTKLDGQ